MTIDPENGFHVGTVLSCIIGVTGQTVYNCLLLPCLPFLIKFYYPDIDYSDIGYYSGYLLSMYYLGQIPGAIFWGWYADQHVNIVCISALGLSRNYYLSLVIRLVHGLTDGTLNVTKTIITEISNDRNISLGTSFIFLGISVGRVVGPLMSGFLTDPTVVKPITDLIPFLKISPFLIPFVIAALVFVIVFIFFVFFAEESLSPEEQETARKYKEDMKRSLSGILRKNPLEGYDSHEQLILQYSKYSSYSSILKDRDVLMAVIIYGIHTFAQMSFDALIPNVYVNKQEYGGFQFPVDAIGWIQMTAFPLSFAPMLLCPLWNRIMPYRKEMFVMNVLVVLCFCIYPLESRFNSSSPLVYFDCGTISIVLVSNTSYKEFRGTIMGLSQTVGSLGRFIGPTLIPPLYAWSCHKNTMWINHRLSFYVITSG
ncbi:tansporter, major facilitor subfamily protein [Blastocystis sp. subtype 4]|uniref:tansporter, major facilitor subfamily protein n=1 Tax=Blastocystis sp. subtype 4 TaxID=944170 RepID=UPI0007119FDC|nr:tansporter, major facilitor subfamily protein [Blastocystis sp. subtype 4]KNB46855.1 tansporter, major facilitor subfamily protein [Blastocystis sp. subtype 4]|eukprot:XP_014530298.1 tansporter, major facilitor subfamily protein [Blastocystis sp. subtype 4]